MPQPVLFLLGSWCRNVNPNRRLGVPPPLIGYIPLPATRFLISGITKNSSGTPLASCTVSLYRTSDNLLLEQTISDANGNYSFSIAGPITTYYIVAYKAGSPDVAGTTVNTLVGV